MGGRVNGIDGLAEDDLRVRLPCLGALSALWQATPDVVLRQMTAPNYVI